ncbi:kinase-like protein, partial [Gonapodya prolifera JEL478]
MGNLLGKEEPIDFNGEVDLHWFNLLRCVGKGAFGKVRIVERRDTKKIFALKYINKIQCIKMKAVHNILRERALLEELQHPFLVNLRYAFQDDENMFMVIDLMMGGDLRFHLDRTGGFTEAMIRYYAAELATVLSYMHKRRIVHRDLKPDNLLLDDRGHCHITDFNIASRFEENKVLKSHSGTLAYMAPEVFESNGYTWTVDWWSLGATLYECLYGRRPFHGSTNEELTVNIRSKHLDFPTYNLVTKQPLQVSKDCISFLQALLERDPKKRIGCTSGRGNLDDVMAHPWFAAVDFERLTRKEYQPPFVPDANHANFDAMYDLEELLLEENPLTHRPRK